ncbi:DNA-binding response regulator [Maribellus luteus]|uniref:DNA-binding response regulator n=1 Tax=Maribellus luteus TaxID=2305463 RepID=A0A399STE5_9BACT|nr:response regulator transcription factor [Maribellus luteus]RIJ47170.1 DNA-binding response regulator [Maribellus luteus]
MNILICDDHKIVRDGLRRILEQYKEVCLIDEAANGREVLKLFSKGIYDLLLLDISLPDQSGLDVLQTIKSKWPAVYVLMLSMHPQEQYAIRALTYGASGYLTKDAAAEELLLAVREISKNGKYISQSLAHCLAFQLNNENNQPAHEKLSDREFEIMIKIAGGKSLKEIGTELCISSKTVSTYRSRIMEKMKLEKNTELARYCIENRLI